MTQAELILQSLGEHGPLDRDALAELLGEQIPAKSMETVLLRLKSRNKVGRTDAGRYFLTDGEIDDDGEPSTDSRDATGAQTSTESPPSERTPRARAKRTAKASKAQPPVERQYAYELHIEEPGEMRVHIAGNSLDTLAAIVEVARSRIEGLRE